MWYIINMDISRIVILIILFVILVFLKKKKRNILVIFFGKSDYLLNIPRLEKEENI